jgi:uncharacterized protein (DUF488 family)
VQQRGVTSVWSVGHSTRSVEALLALLAEHGIAALADVRRYPASRRHPQFARDALQDVCRRAGIAYQWIPELGGRRAPRRDSPNTAWRSAGFRGYADHMVSEEFQLGIARLAELARAQPTACMCAEQAWQHCHRGLICDWLKARGWQPVHILGPGRSEPHPYTAAASIVEGRLSYAAAAQAALEW